MQMEKIRVVVDSMSRQGQHNIAVTLVKEDGKTLPAWEAGAHVDVFLPQNICRQYSLTGRPQEHQTYYTICVKNEIASRGGSRYIHRQLRLGDTLEISYPRNVFSLVDANEYVLLAAGIGVTPILAMAEALEAQGKKFTLFYYVKTQTDVALRSYLEQSFKHGTCHILCDDEGQSIVNGLPEVLQIPNEAHKVYMCGPGGFMQFCEEQLAEQGWQSHCVYKEAFAPIQAPQTANSDGEGFTVKLKSTGQTFEIPAHKSIATVLIENQISVPVSCEMGMCGACLTEVCSGEVDHQDTVQTDEEKSGEQQYIALCCSRSKSKQIEINL